MEKDKKHSITTSSMKTLIDSDLFAVLAWKSKIRTTKYFVVALIACFLNTFCNVSVTVLLLTTILIRRGPRILINLMAARRALDSDELS